MHVPVRVLEGDLQDATVEADQGVHCATLPAASAESEVAPATRTPETPAPKTPEQIADAAEDE
jgi:hypothetical protein